MPGCGDSVYQIGVPQIPGLIPPLEQYYLGYYVAYGNTI
jgi:hypothetical protein